MMKLELYVKYTNGTGRVERVERDDPAGRNLIDKIAFAKMQSHKVRYCSVTRSERTAGGYHSR